LSTKSALIAGLAVGFFSTASVSAAPTAPQNKTATTKSAASKTAAKVAAPKKQATALIIQGRSATFGPYSMQVGDGLNIKGKLGFTIWNKDKPDEVNMLNAETRVFFRDTAAGWLKWNRRGVPLITVSSVELVDKPMVDGRPCNHYIGYQTIQNQKLKVADFVCLQNAPCDKKVQEFWCNHFLLPSKYGFPIAVKQRVLNSMEIMILASTIREVPSSAVSFVIPKDYKRTADKASLYFGDVGGGMSKSDLESFFQQPLK